MAAGTASNLWSLISEAADPAIRARLATGMIVGAAASGLAALAPLALKQMVDAIAAGEGARAALAAGGLYLAAAGLSRVTSLAQTHLFAATDYALQRRLGGLMFSRFLRLPLMVILQKPAGVLIQIQQHALQGVRMLVSLTCLTLLPVLVQMGIILGVVASIFDVWIWLIVATAAVAYMLVFSWGAHRAGASTSSAIESQVEAGKLFADGLANAETVKNLVAEDRLSRRYDDILSSAESHWRNALARRIEVGLAVAAVFMAAMAAALLAGGHAALAGNMTLGEFVLLHAYLVQIITPLEQTGYAMRDIGQGAAHVRGWRELAQICEQGPDDPSAKPAGMPRHRTNAPALRFINVCLEHDEARAQLPPAPVSQTSVALTNVSFDVAAGAFVALVGASGAGKSSILRLLLRHYRLSAGRILIDGRSLESFDVQTIRARTAAMSSDAVLLNGTLADNLRLAQPGASDSRLLEALDAAGLGSWVAALPEGLQASVGDRGVRLSSGERQRVAIARSLLQDADILLLDEPTSALDPTIEQAMAGAIMRAARGRTTLVATHRLLLARQADAIVVLEDGRVAETGAHADLLRANGVYAKLWRSQAQEVADSALTAS
jgi:ABC-type multidrug transport system fused ATPase/permease subunit